VEYYLGVAEEEGISAAEIGAVQGICMAVAGGKLNAQLRQIEGHRKRDHK
jgi:hypothetical protein